MKNLNDQFVTAEIALKLKQLGFNESCLGYYTYNNITKYKLWYPVGDYKNSNCENTDITAPLWQQAIEWLKEKHNIRISIDLHSDADLYYVVKGQFKGKLGYIESALLVAIGLIENNLNEKSIEYFQGSRAGKAGLTPKENPYPKDSKQYDDFLNGMIDSSI